MRPKCERSVGTLNAKPWDVIHRAMRTPMAPSLSRPTHVPGEALHPTCGDAIVGAADHHLFQFADIAVHVAAVRREVEDG